MKKSKHFKIVALAFFVFSFLSCNLDLQEGFTFVPEVDDEDPFADITAWEFLQANQGVIEDGVLSGELYNFMVAAVEAADMVDEYNAAGMNRTYLFLNNSAFAGEDGIVELITGTNEFEQGSSVEQIIATGDLEVLKQILRYHIIDSYVDQLTLAERGVNYEFQTLIPGEGGIMIMRRDERYRIDINDAPAPLPSSATSNSARIRNYNYVVSNGIGHTLAGPVQNQPYPAPNP